MKVSLRFLSDEEENEGDGIEETVEELLWFPGGSLDHVAPNNLSRSHRGISNYTIFLEARVYVISTIYNIVKRIEITDLAAHSLWSELFTHRLRN